MIKTLLLLFLFSFFVFASTDITQFEDKDLTELHELISKSESMEASEKKYWIDELPNLAPTQVENLLKILRDEKRKLAALDEAYQEEKEALDIKHAREWIEEIDSILSTPNAPKPESSFMQAGMEMIDFYLANAKADVNLLDKMVKISDFTLLDTNLSLSQRAKFEYSAYRIHALYSDFAHLNQKKEHLQKSINISRELDATNPELGSLLMALSYVNLCTQDFLESVKNSDEALTYDSSLKDYVYVNKAHALIFLAKPNEAKALYASALTSESGEEIIAAIQDDIEDFKSLKLPQKGIAEIETIVANASR